MDWNVWATVQCSPAVRDTHISKYQFPVVTYFIFTVNFSNEVRCLLIGFFCVFLRGFFIFLFSGPECNSDPFHSEQSFLETLFLTRNKQVHLKDAPPACFNGWS